jgi:molecular chaperone GrpE
VDRRVEPILDDEVVDAEIVDVPDMPQTVVDDLDDLLSAARRERDEYLDLSRRVQADFENYKKRMMRQQTDTLERAAEDLVTKVLPVLDAFDLARAHLGEGDDLSAEGKALVAGSTLLADTLAREGLERIGVAGEPFDPTTHEAVDHVSADAAAPDAPARPRPFGAPGVGSAPTGAGAPVAPEGPVIDAVLRPGYLWKGRVIRPAMVRVRG